MEVIICGLLICPKCQSPNLDRKIERHEVEQTGEYTRCSVVTCKTCRHQFKALEDSQLIEHYEHVPLLDEIIDERAKVKSYWSVEERSRRRFFKVNERTNHPRAGKTGEEPRVQFNDDYRDPTE